MSQTKAILETIDIPVDQIKPSPYQPRLNFNLEDIRGSIQRDGILIPLTVRKKDGYYELIDGERRVRLAKELGYKTIPVTVIDVDDDTSRRMVWKVNTLRQDYSPNEKAYYFLKLQKPPYEMSLPGIARECDIGVKDVKAYLNVLKLPKEYQQMVWDRVIPIRNIRELNKLFNGVARATPEENPEIFELLDRSAREKHFGAEQIREAIRPYLAKLREEQIAKAKEVIEEIEPEVKAPETPEELEEVARALRKEAKRRKTPEQIHKEKQEKARNALLTGRSSVTARIEKAKELGIDTKWMEEEKEKIENKMSDYPDDALSDSRALKRQIDEMIDRAQEGQREAEIREKVEKELKKEKVEEIKEELRQDEEFKQEVRTELMKEMMGRPSIEPFPPVEIPEEEAKVLRERIEEQRQKMMEWMLDPEIQKRGKLFKNWVAHGTMLEVMGSVFCPKDGEKSDWKNLKWSCCGLSVEEAYEMLRKKLSRTSASTIE